MQNYYRFPMQEGPTTPMAHTVSYVPQDFNSNVHNQYYFSSQYNTTNLFQQEISIHRQSSSTMYTKDDSHNEIVEPQNYLEFQEKSKDQQLRAKALASYNLKTRHNSIDYCKKPITIIHQQQSTVVGSPFLSPLGVLPEEPNNNISVSNISLHYQKQEQLQVQQETEQYQLIRSIDLHNDQNSKSKEKKNSQQLIYQIKCEQIKNNNNNHNNLNNASYQQCNYKPIEQYKEINNISHFTQYQSLFQTKSISQSTLEIQNQDLISCRAGGSQSIKKNFLNSRQNSQYFSECEGFSCQNSECRTMQNSTNNITSICLNRSLPSLSLNMPLDRSNIISRKSNEDDSPFSSSSPSNAKDIKSSPSFTDSDFADVQNKITKKISKKTPQKQGQYQVSSTKNVPKIYISALTQYLESPEINQQLKQHLASRKYYISQFKNFYAKMKDKQTIYSMRYCCSKEMHAKNDKYQFFTSIIRKFFFKFLREESTSYFYTHKKITARYQMKSFARNLECLVRFPDKFQEIRNPYGLA